MTTSSGDSETGDLHTSVAGIDMASAYAADSYVISSDIADPWAQQCFLNIVDCFTDHGQLLLPQATHFSAEHTGSTHLPEIVRCLLREKAISLPARRVAEDLVPDSGTLTAAFREFRLFATQNRRSLTQWLHFHHLSAIREHHPVHVPTGVQNFVSTFWPSEPKTALLSEKMAISSADLMYAFDAFYRGQQYDEILSSENAIYFNHPMRSSLFSQRARLHDDERKHYSWGRLLARLMKDHRMSRRLDELADVIVKIRTEVNYNDATSDQLLKIAEHRPSEVPDRLRAVAASVGLPAKFSSSADIAATCLAGGVGMIIDGSCHTSGWATWTLTTATAMLRLESRYVPAGVAGALKLCRGAMKWTELLDDD